MYSKSYTLFALLLLLSYSASPFSLVDLLHNLDHHHVQSLSGTLTTSQLLESHAKNNDQIFTTINTALYNAAEKIPYKYQYTPPALPLSPLIKPEFSDLVAYGRAVTSLLADVEEAVAEDAITVKDVLEEAILPSNNIDLSAIVIGEISAGIIGKFFYMKICKLIYIHFIFIYTLGGLSSQVAARLLNDKKRDSFVNEEISTGAYFGVRSLVRVASGLVGIPRPIANFLAGITASLFAESAKVEGRRRDRKFMKSIENMSMRPFDSDDRPGDLVVDRRFFLREDIRRKGE
jgi:hypothetical protein